MHIIPITVSVQRAARRRRFRNPAGVLRVLAVGGTGTEERSTERIDTEDGVPHCVDVQRHVVLLVQLVVRTSRTVPSIQIDKLIRLD